MENKTENLFQRKIILPLFLYLYLISAGGLLAQDQAAQEAANMGSEESSEDEDQDKGGLVFSGYFDTYYFGNLNKPSTRNSLGSSGISRGFDRYVGQFQLGMLLTRINYTNGPKLLEKWDMDLIWSMEAMEMILGSSGGLQWPTQLIRPL